MQLVVEVVALILMARLVEPVYGSKETIKFIFIVDFVTCFTVFICVYLAYAASIASNEHAGDLLYTQFYGFHGVAAGLLVAVKQVMQEQEMALFGILRISFKVRSMDAPVHAAPLWREQHRFHPCSTSHC